MASGAVAPAYAALGGPVGVIDPVNGFPMSYSDGTVALAQCLDGPQCLAGLPLSRPNMAAPVSFPDNFPEEQFWYQASAGTAEQPAIFEAAIEGTPAGTFARLRFTLKNVQPNATYTIVHPYGSNDVTADARGLAKGVTDKGCFNVPCTAAGFDLARTGFIGTALAPTFLRQINPAPPAGFIGNPNVPATVTGGSGGVNSVTATGPDVGGLGTGINTLSTNLFTVQGRIAGVPVAPSALVPTATTAVKNSALVSWTAPDNGGSPITGYSVRVVNAKTLAQVGALRPVTPAVLKSANSLNITGLTGGTLLRFQVQATNAAGVGAFSARSAVAVPKSTATMVGNRKAFSGVAGGASTARATWVKPRSNGGLMITGYVVTAYRMSPNGKIIGRIGSRPQRAGTFALTMKLPKGNYRFAVRARNSLGMGAISQMSNLVAAR